MDREKVIKEFELFIKEFHPACTSEGVELDMFREVLALLKEQEEEIENLKQTAQSMMEGICLLKEQEAVKPEAYYVGPDKYRFYRCPVCKTAWYYKGKYCLGCGRTVKWE